MSDEAWRRCSSCREPIPFETAYYVCNVSTCNRRNTAFVFCSVDCWDAHLPTMNHREAWAEEKKSPGAAEWRRQQAAESEPAPKPAAERERSAKREPRRRVAPSQPAQAAPSPPPAANVPREVLVIASRLKDYIKARSGMNTSDRVLAPLSDLIRTACDKAIENARRDERKTVLDRDIR